MVLSDFDTEDAPLRTNRDKPSELSACFAPILNEIPTKFLEPIKKIHFLLAQLAQLASLELTKQLKRNSAPIVVNPQYTPRNGAFAHVDATRGVQSLGETDSKHFLSLLQALVDSELEKGKGTVFQAGSGVWVIDFDSVRDAVTFGLCLLDKMSGAHFFDTELARIGIYQGNNEEEAEVVAIQAAEVSSQASAGQVLVGSAFQNGVQTIPDWGTGIVAQCNGLMDTINSGVSETVSIFSCSWEQGDAKWRRLSYRRESIRLERKRSLLLRQSCLVVKRKSTTRTLTNETSQRSL